MTITLEYSSLRNPMHREPDELQSIGLQKLNTTEHACMHLSSLWLFTKISGV